MKMRQEIRRAVASGDEQVFSVVLGQVAQGDAQDVVDALCVLACPDGRVDLVSAFLDAGFAPDTRSRGETTLLMWASYWGSLPVAERLLAAGADVNARDVELRTPLMFAVSNQREEIVRRLVAAGADQTLQDTRGDTALSMAELRGTGLALPFGMHLSIQRRVPDNPIARWLREQAPTPDGS